MGNVAAATVKGKCNVVIKFTFGKEMILLDVLHVPKICKNLVSGPMLSKKGFKLVFESDKLVITKEGLYVGKGYLNEWLFKIIVLLKLLLKKML